MLRVTSMRALGWVLIFLLIGGLVMGPVLIDPINRLPYPAHGLYSDLTLTHWSAFEYTRDQLAKLGQIPLWRTSILSGTPFASNPLAGLFYPPHWLAIWPTLPLSLALNILLWLHFVLAAAAMYALMRRWQVKRVAALASAVAFAAAPKIVAHMGLGHLTLVEAWAWLPVVIYPLPVPPPFAQPERSGAKSKDANRGGGIVSGVVLGLCVLADARMAIYAGVLAVTYMIVIGALRDRSAWLKVLGRVLIVVVVAAAISAVAWLPTLDLSANTARSTLATDESGVLSLDPVFLLGLLIPDRSGAAERTTFVGWTVLALALIAAVPRRVWSNHLRAWLLGVIIVGAIVALGTNTPVYDLIAHIPGASLLRVPARAWFMVSFAFAALAGLGVQRLMNAPNFNRRRGWMWSGLIALIALDVLSVDWSVYRVTTVTDAFADGRAVAQAVSVEANFRVYSPSLSIPQHVAQQFNLQLADGVDPLQLARYVKFMQAATGLGAWRYSVTLPPFPGIQSDADVSTALRNIVPDARL